MEPKIPPELICILFPGIVKNSEKAIQCLGGIQNISQVYSQTVLKLGLSYHPEDPYRKKIYADYRKTSGVLLKVKVKKTKTGSEVKREVISTAVVGRVNRIYKFESMCDFQYLPIQSDENGQKQCIIDQILPSELGKSDFMQEPGPLFIVPNNFTRAERPYNYAYTDKRNPEKIEDTDKDLVVHRRSRCVPVQRYVFSLTNELPTEPNEYSLKKINQRIKLHPQLVTELDTIKKMFNERPIWSYNLIKHHTKYRTTILKIILPCVALYMHSGPWKKLWVKYGYDPRKTPEARIYQSLDVRVRSAAGMNFMVMKRKELTQSRKAEKDRRSDKLGAEELGANDEVGEGAVYFRPGTAPTQRQMFYQYCDVKLPEVEELLAMEPPAGYLCHPARGWLPPGTDQACRDYVYKYMKVTMFSKADLKLERGGSSDDESGSNSDEDTDGAGAATEDEAT